MLSQIKIKNYSLIGQCEIVSGARSIAITGETGSGKSLILDPIYWALGHKPRGTELGATEKSYIELVFILNGSSKVFYKELHKKKYSYKIGAEKTSKSTFESELNKLVSFYGQFSQIKLRQSDFLLSLIDQYGSHSELVNACNAKYLALVAINKRLADCKYSPQRYEELLELNTRHETLSSLELSFEQILELENKLKLYENATTIKSELELSKQLCDEMVNKGSRLKTILEAIGDPKLSNILQLLTTSTTCLEELNFELKDHVRDFNFEPHELLVLEEKMNQVNELCRKFNINLDFLPEFINSTAREFSELEQARQEYDILLKEVARCNDDYFQASKKLSLSRNAVKTSLVQAIENDLKLVGIDYGRFDIELEHSSTQIRSLGGDRVKFLASTDPSRDLGELTKTLSGGELSRYLLVLTLQVASAANTGTMIFDEIDTGISGSAARTVGSYLQSMAKQKQIITITHLPQVAAKAELQLGVHKTLVNEQYTTEVKVLNKDERVTAIAAMMSGELNEASIKAAETLL